MTEFVLLDALLSSLPADAILRISVPSANTISDLRGILELRGCTRGRPNLLPPASDGIVLTTPAGAALVLLRSPALHHTYQGLIGCGASVPPERRVETLAYVSCMSCLAKARQAIQLAERGIGGSLSASLTLGGSQ